MIHYTCDLCKQEIGCDDSLRYVVKMEIYAAFDPVVVDDEDDRDHLEEVQEMLDRLDDAEDPNLGEDVYQQLRFDLCPECRRKFSRNPLGRDLGKMFDLSSN